MQSFLLSVNVIVPLFLLMVTGYACKRFGIFGESTLDSINKLLNVVLLPAMLFQSVYEADLTSSVDLLLMGYVGIAITVTVACLLAIVPRFVKSDARRGAAIQGIFRGNSSVFGISLALLLLKDGNLGQLSFLISLVVILYNVYSIVVLERYRGRSASVGAILKNVALNPLVLSVVFGLALNLLFVPMPSVISTFVASLSSSATAIGFLVLGASFTFASARQNRKILICCVIAKLILVPLVWLGAAILLGWRGTKLCLLMVLFVAPTALSSFPIAMEMNADAQLAGEIVVFTSAFSLVSVFLWIYALSAAKLI